MTRRVFAAGLMAGLLLTTFLAAGGSRQTGELLQPCALFQEYPAYDDRSASVEKLTVVTFNDGEAFCRLLTLSAKHPLDDQMPWCGYEGFDEEYHYASALKYPAEIYRVRRNLVDRERLMRQFTRGEPRSQDESGTTISLPVSTIASEWLNRAALDRSLVPIDLNDLQP